MGEKKDMAIEFLLVYGWAFLVIIAMIGALAYFGVFNRENIWPSSIGSDCCDAFCDTLGDYYCGAWNDDESYVRCIKHGTLTNQTNGTWYEVVGRTFTIKDKKIFCEHFNPKNESGQVSR